MKNLITLLAIITIGFSSIAQERILRSVEEVRTELNEKFDFKYKEVPATTEFTARIEVELAEGTYLMHYLTNGLNNDDSFVYQSIMMIDESQKGILNALINVLNEKYNKTDSHNWYSYKKGLIILVEWKYESNIQADVIVWSIRTEE